MQRKSGSTFVLTCIFAFIAIPGFSHELWIAAPARVEPGRAVSFEVCFGHLGERTTGEMLRENLPKIHASVRGPNGQDSPLPLSVDEDGYPTKWQFSESGVYQFFARYDAGIIERTLFDMKPGTRIVMLAKAITRAGAAAASAESLGQPIEIVPMVDVTQLKVGDRVRLKILVHGEPVGGPDVLVRLATSGTNAEGDAELTEHAWTIEGHPDPNGEVVFPLVARGLHIASISFMEEKPGTYDGPLDFASNFSHLKPGDRFQRTRWVVTLAFPVE
ncbi:MAG: DUF4198 domain-containing protein [Thermogutta sp.]